MNVLLLHVNDVARFWDNFIKLFTQNYDVIKNILVKGYMLSIRAFHIRSHRRAREICAVGLKRVTRRWFRGKNSVTIHGLAGKLHFTQETNLRKYYF